MRRLGDTITRLNGGSAAASLPWPGASSRLTALPSAGSNPGELDGWAYVPGGSGSAALVVVLHGCTQTAAGYDIGAGWSALADRYGFALLFPQQRRANNPNLCFNWFSPGDNRRDTGELLSIRQMVTAMVERYRIDPARVFATGLSAGGAMTAALLASYPECFAGGAVIAGLPFAAADSMMQALDRMQGRGHVGDDIYAARVREASAHCGPWPIMSVWHGTADRTVAASNADAIVGQWRSLHGADAAPDGDETAGTVRRRTWHGHDGRVVVEDYRIAGMGHGTPLGIAGEGACGSPGAYMLDAGISSTWHIAKAWGLIDEEPLRPAAATVRPQPAAAAGRAATGSVQETIEAAMRAAGLMR